MERDLTWLAMLLEHSFLATRHFLRDCSDGVATRRLARLHACGVLAVTREQVHRGRASHYVYGLTRLGFDPAPSRWEPGGTGRSWRLGASVPNLWYA